MSNKNKPRKTRVVEARPAGPDHQVVSVVGGSGSYRKTPCGGCPWRVDQTGTFPPEAFVHSARTAYDMSSHQFSCNESGAKKPATCAGFLLRGADHNLGVRMRHLRGEMLDVEDAGLELHEGYREMAIANGVAPDHPDLKPCR